MPWVLARVSRLLHVSQCLERVQRLSKQRRERAYQVTENQILVEQLAAEQVTRERNRPIYKMIFRRVTTF